MMRLCDYLADVFRYRQKDSENSAVFVDAGVVGGTSWIDKKIIKVIQKIEFRTDYPWGEVVQTIALAAAKSGTQVITRPQPYSLKEEVCELVWEYPIPVWSQKVERWNWKQVCQKNIRLQIKDLPESPKCSYSRRLTEDPGRIHKYPVRKAPATPARTRPEKPSVATTPATGTRSKAERRQEKKAARKEETWNKRAEKSARKAEKADEVPSVFKTPVRRKLDEAMQNAGSIESVLLLV